MKKLILISALALAGLLSVPAYAQTYVDGYFRSDGTYVQGHFRSSPNRSRYDNYSTWGNTNPFTGKKGYQNKRCRYSYNSQGIYC